ncbi:MAG: hypothetical protein AAGD96_32425, partial [Chloroflexota bacterium]
GGFGDGILLQNWEIQAAGNVLDLTFFWQANKSLDKPYTAFVHVLDDDGNIIAQLDRPPAGYPTDEWRSGEMVVDRLSIPIPEGADYSAIRTGFYYLPTLEPLGQPITLPVP